MQYGGEIVAAHEAKTNKELAKQLAGPLRLALGQPVIFALTLVIQGFVYTLTFIPSVQRMRVSVGVPVALVRGDVYYWGSLMAACLLTSVPIAVLYNFVLDRFIAASRWARSNRGHAGFRPSLQARLTAPAPDGA